MSEKVRTIEEMATQYAKEQVASSYSEGYRLAVKGDYLAGATAQRTISDKQAEEREREWKEKIVDVFNWLTCIDWNGADRYRYFAVLKTKYNIQDGI